MEVLAFDGRMGASGDMLLGALVAAGADPGSLDPVEAALDVRYAVGETTKNGIRATTVDVIPERDEDSAGDGADGRDSLNGTPDHEHGHRPYHGHLHDHGHQHDHRHDHDHDHGHGHHNDHEGSHPHGSGQADRDGANDPRDAGDEHHGTGTDDHHHGEDHRDAGDEHREGASGRRQPGHAEGAGPLRSYPEVVDLVTGMGLPDAVEADAIAVFERLGEAEASIHGTDLESTHFHEVGADDAIADVVGTALLLADLDPDRVVTTPLATGGGEVAMSHGRYPVPPPAVVEIAAAADWPIRGGPVDTELLTPTGAAILAHVAEGVDRLPALRVTASGYGAGDRDFPEHPNVLRAIVGELAESDATSARSAAAAADERGGGLVQDEIRVLETNVDDVSPEVLGGLHETLSEAGARDVSFVPLSMKKSRPGHLVSVVVKPEDVERVARRLAEETGTLGIRETGARHRWIADRRFVTATLAVDGSRHEVAVKVAATADGQVYDVSAEYADAADVARRSDIPAREVMRRAEAAAREGGALSPVLLHVVEAEDWRAVEDGDEDRYAPPSVEAEGFVHLSPSERVVGVGQYNYPDADDPRLLVVDRERIETPVRYEETDAGAFPHAYGPLNVDAIVDVLPFPREGGRYRLPDGLSEWTTERAE